MQFANMMFRFSRIFTVVLTAVLLVAGPNPANASDAEFKTTQGHIERKQYWQAVSALRKLSQKGHLEARLNLAELLVKGLGVKSDPVESAKLLHSILDAEAPKKATLAQAQEVLAIYYFQGIGVAQDFDKSRLLHIEAAKNGDVSAIRSLTEEFRVRKKFDESLKWNYIGAAAGDDVLLKKWQHILRTVSEKRVNRAKKAAEAIRPGINAGFDDGSKTQDVASSKKRPTPAKPKITSPSPTKETFADALGFLSKNQYASAARVLQQLSDNRNLEARLYLAELLLRGLGVSKDEKKSAELLQSVIDADWSRKKDLSHAQVNLAAYYFKGVGVPRDTDKALDLYIQAALNDNLSALNILSNDYYKGGPYGKNIDEALKWTFIGAASGHTGFRERWVTFDGTFPKQKVEAAKQAAERIKPGTIARFGNLPPLYGISSSTGIPRHPVSPSAGYSPELAALHKLPASKNADIITDLNADLMELTPPYIFELSRRLALEGKIEQSVDTYWFARVRAVSDAMLCSDTTVFGGVQQWDNIVQDIVKYMKKRPNLVKKAIAKAIALDEKVPGKLAPSWICFHGTKAISAAASGKEFKNWHRPRSEWSNLRQQYRDNLAQRIR